jgi:Fe2+ or Zn2+ uptake regulation protein
MMRGTFANVRLKNLLAPSTEGGFTRHLPDGAGMSIFDAAMKYIGEKVPTIVFGLWGGAVADAAELGGHWNPATVYRSLMLFLDAEVVRQLRLNSKLSYFSLNIPGEGMLYVVCTRCGSLTGRPLNAAIRSLVHELNAASGFAAAEEELALFGLCPACRKAALHKGPTLKLPPRIGAVAAAKSGGLRGWLVAKTERV